MKRHKNSISGMSYPQFLWLIAGIGGACLLYLGWYYAQPPKLGYIQKPTTQTYSFNYHLTYCGDKTSGGTNSWYPVYTTYSAENLKIIRQSFCCNAFYDSSVNLIQVSSFYNRSKATKLVSALKSRNLKSTWIGEGQIVTTSASKSRNNCK
jgi:hypothetical protein